MFSGGEDAEIDRQDFLASDISDNEPSLLSAWSVELDGRRRLAWIRVDVSFLDEMDGRNRSHFNGIQVDGDF